MERTAEITIPARPNLYVYFHSRPDGRVFYIGKGSNRRAFDMAPSRRSAHHMNIVRKYGRTNIQVRLIAAMHHTEAFHLERAHIAIAKASGLVLINLTSGGEGTYGRALTDKQKAGLKKGRGNFHNLSAESQAAILAGLARGRSKPSPAREIHAAALGRAAFAWLHVERTVSCAECSKMFVTRSASAKNCSRLCEQRGRRARQRG